MAHIILKFDDLSQETLESFKKIHEICKKYCALSSFGLIGSSLSDPDKEYVADLKEFEKSGVEIWNHGYHHTDEEFSVCTYQQQKESIGNTQELMMKYLGNPASTFGSPHNNSTELTISVLGEHFPKIRNYLFMADASGRTDSRQLLMRCNYEIKTGLIDLDFFSKEYNRIKKYPFFIMQGHPSFWTEDDFKRFEEILRILVDDGNSFVTPKSLRDYEIKEYREDILEKEIDNIKRFFELHNSIYYYGAGEIGREVYRYFDKRGYKPTGFVVSDGHKSVSDVCGVPVYELSEIFKYKTKIGIIPTILGKTHGAVLNNPMLVGFDIWMTENVSIYDEIIDYIRFELSL
ncbi:DUF2334 domain-containing protein [Oribacterium sp. NK2B42]|uniref:DUF2334 domain-containing protein n=1 Tax=Oribacterium sp. NK2B42 TaxID=689781 RepID=UPI00040E9D3B|nr:DUF2334 domain-containing protein [Oribacterium sp. NK2B42]